MLIHRICNQLLQSASYLIDYKVLIDCGDVDKLPQGVNVGAVILTHCHQDHVYGLQSVLDRFPSAKVYCSKATSEGLKESEKNLSYIMPEFPFEFTQDSNVVLIEEGVNNIVGYHVRAIATPGHSDDCMSYIIGNCIFTGDSYIPFAKVFTKWPRSNKQLAIENEAKLKQTIEDNQLKVYPGHWK